MITAVLALFNGRKLILAALAIAYFAASYGAVYYMGRNRARAECDSAALQAQLAKTQADLDRLQRAAAAANIEREFLRTMKTTYDKRVTDLEKALDDERSAQIKTEPAPVNVPGDDHQPAPPVVVADGKACPAPDRTLSADDLRRLRQIGRD
jgi:hypothetical protein